MVRCHFIVFFVILIFSPQITGSLLFEPVEQIINMAGNITCKADDGTINYDCNLCAIRVYAYTNGTTDEMLNVTTWNCVRFTNVFRQYIQARNCTDFKETNDIGISACAPMPYENVDLITLCICATDNCTQELSTCYQSVNQSVDSIKLKNIMPNLTTKIECANTSFQYDPCSLPTETSLIDYSACLEYVQNDNVLCVISNDGSETYTQLALTYENYQIYVMDELYRLTPIISSSTVDSSNTSIYAKYPSAAGIWNYQCGCAYSSLCNKDMVTCASSLIQTETNDTSELSTDASADVTLESATTEHITLQDSLSTSAITWSVSSTIIDITTVSSTPSTSSTTGVTSSTSSTLFTNTTTVSSTPSTSSTTGVTSSTSSTLFTNTTTVSSTPSTSSTTDVTSSTSSTLFTNTTTVSSTPSTSSTTGVTSSTSSTLFTNTTTVSSTPSTSSTTDVTSSTSSTLFTNTTTVSSTPSTSSTTGVTSSTSSTLFTNTTTVSTTPSTSSTNNVTSSASSTLFTNTTTGSTISASSSSTSNVASSASSTTNSISTTSSSSKNATVANSPSNSTGLSRGAIAGIVVGSVVGGVIIISMGIFACVGSGKVNLPFDRSAGYRL